ncbi:flavin reductase family protein [Arsenicicoccus piscis]|uniref:flavin reductase family protein n=1 Tax=Arsenicicoccus piscis TaxID=673954 RepID=UPI0024E15E2F|nr:flavin reductase family protein [Arsenicicoccus piscis]
MRRHRSGRRRAGRHGRRHLHVGVARPPLVAFLPATTSYSWARIRSSGHFCINVLSANQESTCRALASRSADKFAGVAWHPAETGSPIIDGAVAWIDCDLETVHEAGDHHIAIGRVRDLDVQEPGVPLLFFQGGFGRFSPHMMVTDLQTRPEQRLIDQARTRIEQVAEASGCQVVAARVGWDGLTMLAGAGSPADPRVPTRAIGEVVPLQAPLGAWWVAFGSEADQERWLAQVADFERADFRAALAAIRAAGFGLGLRQPVPHTEGLLASRPVSGESLTSVERQAWQQLAADPREYVPTEDTLDQPTAALPDVISVWAPTFDADGRSSVGVMLSGFAHDERPLRFYADQVRALADEVTRLAGGRSTVTPSDRG